MASSRDTLSTPRLRVITPDTHRDAGSLEWPLRAPEVELVGRMQDSGFDEERWLICYADSHYIQATKLLYHVLLHADGATHIEEIARRVAADTALDVGVEHVSWLIENRLAPSGLLVLPEGDSPAGDAGEQEPDTDGARGDGQGSVTDATVPLLGLRWRLPLLPYKVTAPVTGVLQFLFWPPIMLAVAIIAVAVNIWVYRTPGLVRSVQTLAYEPDLVLLLFGITLGSVLFHELGHASALRRAGCRYGVIGFALYIIWPVFYTDVTHVYRLSRKQRLMVDIGGIYFHLIAVIAIYVAYQYTMQPILLLAIVFIGFDILEQFTPFLRFDGYYLLADLSGLPEPMSLIGPFVRDRLPWRRGQARALPPLRRTAVLALTTYLVLVVGFLLYPFLLGTIFGKELLEQIPASGQFAWYQLNAAWQDGEAITIAVAALQFLVWFLIPLSLALFAFTILRHFGRLLARILDIGRRSWHPWCGIVAVPVSASQPEEAEHVLERERGDMKIRQPGQSDTVEDGGARAPVEIDDVIERIGAQYVATLRALSGEIGHAYAAEIEKKDEQISDLTRQVEDLQRERDELLSRMQAGERATAQYIADLRALSQELARRADAVSHEWDALGARTDGFGE